MAADSLIGGVEGYDDLPDSTKTILDSFLEDTRDGSVEIDTLDGGTLVTGLGADNEVQSVFIPDGSGDPATVTSDGFTITLDGNDHTVLTIESPVGPTDYFASVVDSIVGGDSPEADALNESLSKALDYADFALDRRDGHPPGRDHDHSRGRGRDRDDDDRGNGRGDDDDRGNGNGRGNDDDRGNGNGRGNDDDRGNGHGNGNGNGNGHGDSGNDAPDGAVRIVQIIDEDTGPVTISGDEDSKDVVVLAMNNTEADVIVEGLDKVVIAGSGTVTISNDEDVVVAGDLNDQDITGGDGNDSLIGGAGVDTVTGGEGDDIFGFVGGEGTHTTITDFSEGDKIAFDMDGVSNREVLYSMLVNTETVDGNFTASFSDGSSITLVGVSADEVTADLLFFHI